MQCHAQPLRAWGCCHLLVAELHPETGCPCNSAALFSSAHLPQAQLIDPPVLCPCPCVLQASSGVKQWNKRWFVLVDRCLFYYKGEFAPGIGRGCRKPGPTLFLVCPVTGLCFRWMLPAGGGQQISALWSLAPVGCASGIKTNLACSDIHSLFPHSAVLTESLLGFTQSSRP